MEPRSRLPSEIEAQLQAAVYRTGVDFRGDVLAAMSKMKLDAEISESAFVSGEVNFVEKDYGFTSGIEEYTEDPDSSSPYAPSSFTVYEETPGKYVCVNPIVVTPGKSFIPDVPTEISEGTWFCHVYCDEEGSFRAELSASGSDPSDKEEVVASVKIVEITSDRVEQYHTGAIVITSGAKSGALVDDVSIYEYTPPPEGGESEGSESEGSESGETPAPRHAIMNWHNTTEGIIGGNNALTRLIGVAPKDESSGESSAPSFNGDLQLVARYLPYTDGGGFGSPELKYVELGPVARSGFLSCYDISADMSEFLYPFVKVGGMVIAGPSPGKSPAEYMNSGEVLYISAQSPSELEVCTATGLGGLCSLFNSGQWNNLIIPLYFFDSGNKIVDLRNMPSVDAFVSFGVTGISQGG